MPMWNSLNFQDSASPLMTQMNYFHDHSLMILFTILLLIAYALFAMMNNKLTTRFLLENQTIEIIWTIIPMFILICISLPSLRLLYLLEEINDPSLTLKISGNQWFWSYEYSEFPLIQFDSYMLPSSEALPRLLEVDNRLTLPHSTQIRLLITASDVIHSWALPVLGVKMDAIPGRLNQSNLLLTRPGIFFGQCSEICGANHSFMPILLESVNSSFFLKWVNSF